MVGEVKNILHIGRGLTIVPTAPGANCLISLEGLSIMNADLIGSTSIARRFHINLSTAKEWVRALKDAGDPGVLTTEAGRFYLTRPALRRLERRFKKTITRRSDK